MIEAVRAYETYVYFETTRRYIPEDCHLHTRRRKNLKSQSNYMSTSPQRRWFVYCPCEVVICSSALFLVQKKSFVPTQSKSTSTASYRDISSRDISQKAVPQHTYGSAEERRYSSYSFTTSALDGSEWSASRPGRALPPGKGLQVPIGQRGWVGPRAGLDTGFKGNILLPCQRSNVDCLGVQSVARHYTDWATPAPKTYIPLLVNMRMMRNINSPTSLCCRRNFYLNWGIFASAPRHCVCLSQIFWIPWDRKVFFFVSCLLLSINNADKTLCTFGFILQTFQKKSAGIAQSV
jgi:hypothetical protein